MWLAEVGSDLLEVLDVTARLLAVLAIPLLGAVTFRRVRGARGRWGFASTTLARAAAVAIAALLLVGVVAGLALDVPNTLGMGLLAVAALVAVLFADDDEFWTVLCALLVLFGLIGAVQLVGLSYSFEDEDGQPLWLGTRQLVAYGGIRANPARPGWEWAVASMSIVQFGFPLALAATTAWAAGTGRRESPSERLGVSVVSASAVTTVLGSSAFMVIAFFQGALSGLPPVLSAVGALAAVVTLLLVGPGAVGAVLVGGRAIGSLLPGPIRSLTGFRDSADPLRTGLADARGGVARQSFLHWARGNVGWKTRWTLKAIGLFVAYGVANVGIAAISPDPALATPRGVRVSYEVVDVELGVGFVVDRIHAAEGSTVWLLGEGGEVARFDTDTEALRVVEEGLASVAAEGERVVGLTAAAPHRLVDVGGGDAEPLGTLVGAFPGSLALHGESVYIASDRGRVARWSTSGGEPLAVVDGPPVERLSVGRSGVWTEHETAPFLGAEVARLVRRDLETLDVSFDSGETGGGVVDVVVPGAGEPVVIAPGGVIGAIDPSTGAVSAPLRRTAAGDDARLVADAHGAPAHVATPVGHLEPIGPRGSSRRLHYDSIVGTIDLGEAVWFVVTNDRGVVIDRRSVDQSFLVRSQP